MRTYDPINPVTGNPRANFRYELETLAFYLNDPVAVQQASLLIDTEYWNWVNSGPDEYRPSKLVRQVLNDMNRRSSRVFVTGVVAMLMCLREILGKQPSLKRAAEIASEYVYAHPKAPFLRWDDGELKETQPSVPADVDTIERYYREYLPAAHICAARVACVEYLELRGPFESAFSADACFYSTAVWFQKFLREDPRFAQSDFWRLIIQPGSIFFDHEPLVPSYDVMLSILQPWQEKTGGVV